MVVGSGQENADNNGAAALVLGDKVWQLFLQKWSLSSSKSPEFFNSLRRNGTHSEGLPVGEGARKK